ncbi:MAG: hypothetical protein JNK21_15905 [Rhodospirillaceae bacterium]|nr:hypothetical protein [Rhodospirillaceae bacterium]
MPALALAAGICFGATPAAAASKTLGFVVTTWNTGIYESKFIDECPEGFSPGYDEVWWRGLSKADRGKLTDNGLKSRLDRYFVAIRRGPNGEDVCMNPTVVKDPPLLTVEGKVSYGMNLDGNDTGEATPKTCKHQNFTGLDGTPGVDNQVYRLLGCVYGFRSYGQYEANANENRKSNGNGMTLIEISGVDDERNDDDVTVSFYRAIDQYTLDGAGRFTPFASYRIDFADGKPRYGSTLKGKIVNGKVVTVSGDVHLPFYGNYTYMNQLVKDLRMELELSEDGASAKGTAAGYYDLDQLLFYVTGVGPIASSGFSNCPSIYVAAHELADGYPDENGKCTALSTAFNFAAVSAFIIHPPESQKTAAAGPSGAAGR